jgi:isoleucyl-tRNA synthetase
VKDRLYTCKNNSIARRSCQTSLDILLNKLIKLIAPILSFTSEEIWQLCPSLLAQEDSVFLSNFSDNNEKISMKIDSGEWKRIFEIKDIVNQSIEQMRNENALKGSLDAIVNIEANEEDFKILDKLGEELHFLFISSEASITLGKELKINITCSENKKCTRCWHRDSTVGNIKNHPEICGRCIENIEKDGEQRSFV